ncbi:response regulator [bacterium CG_4_10_14_0_2_um_filter_33_32]|nr:MAG: hypothetical protein AUJ93_04645 [bacterium CG2_30_33_46]PIR67667.1 MAG: response regulator [bacterium CG10_big_fil_rev_8_21_14_0_10_33_18]PIU76503.1 MAG: response regulator [bacterium CG06_land_8_20_14_3_00_33_50]PIW80933.1 MAG: response regulator [bacterium CG_4_8_14_3_um_filter_33_28]PIY85759.1 MAG: response regulator [bacterium CG_4_10_14_0_8_um_filter_33_57]PIZ86064.1 MAG: response regulator [bacterium CG_4_10_14_0_2_um_filter_33_32]PJA71882.1 MAG: response regulator [bacterium C
MKKIFLIEDDVTLAEMYEEQFKMSGFDTVVAKNSEEVIQKIDSSMNLILLDILLPDKNGFEVLKDIKSKNEYKNIPVIILTNLGVKDADRDIKLAISLGATDYLVKAYNTPDQVVNKVKEILK